MNSFTKKQRVENEEGLAPLFPEALFSSHVAARSAIFEWATLCPTDIQKSSKRKLVYQLSKSDERQIGVYTVVWEGSAYTHEVSSLIPCTEYKFKLRLKFQDSQDSEDAWSRKSLSCEFRSTDESEITRAYIEIVRYIRDSKATALHNLIDKYGKMLDYDSRDKTGRTLLMLACQYSTYEIVSLLLNAGASPQNSTKSGKSALSTAVTYGNVKAVQCLLCSNADVNVADNGGSTPLMWCAENMGHPTSLEILDLIIRSGAQVSKEDNYGRNAFDRMCISGHAKGVEVLLNAGASQINAVSERHANTSLMIAANNGNLKVCQVLVQLGADIHAKSHHGFTALDMVTNKGDRVVIETYLRALHKSPPS